VEQDMKFR